MCVSSFSLEKITYGRSAKYFMYIFEHFITFPIFPYILLRFQNKMLRSPGKNLGRAGKPEIHTYLIMVSETIYGPLADKRDLMIKPCIF